MDLTWCLQDRSLAFHQLCALYAITGSLLLGRIALTLFAKDHLAWRVKVHGCTHKRNMQLFSCQGFLHVYGEDVFPHPLDSSEN
jgi:hypothetical protein